MRGNGDTQEEAETRVTVQDHDISGVMLQFAPVPSIPVELIVESSSTSDNVQPPTLPQFGLTLQSEQQDPERGDAMVRMAPREGPELCVYHSSGDVSSGRGGIRERGLSRALRMGIPDLLQEELVVVPGAAGTPIRVTVSNGYGELLQWTVSFEGESASPAWIFTLCRRAPSAQAAVMTLHIAGPREPIRLRIFASREVTRWWRLNGKGHSVNYREIRQSLAAFSSYVHSLTVNAGDKPTLNLDAVPVTEVTP